MSGEDGVNYTESSGGISSPTYNRPASQAQQAQSAGNVFSAGFGLLQQISDFNFAKKERQKAKFLNIIAARRSLFSTYRQLGEQRRQDYAANIQQIASFADARRQSVAATMALAGRNESAGGDVADRINSMEALEAQRTGLVNRNLQWRDQQRMQQMLAAQEQAYAQMVNSVGDPIPVTGIYQSGISFAGELAKAFVGGGGGSAGGGGQ